MLSGCLIGMPKRVMDLLLLRNVGASLTVVHFVALLRLFTSVKLANSQRPFRHGKKDFGLAVTRSPTNTLLLHRTVFSRLAHFGDALRLSRSTKLCWSHLRLHLGILKVPARKQTTLCFPSLGPGATSQGVKPFERPDTAELPEDQPHGEEEIFQEAMEHFHEIVRESETRTSADVPVQDEMNIEELAEGLLKRASEPASGATSSAEPPTSRPRVGPPPSVERKRETSDVPEATTKVQRIS